MHVLLLRRLVRRCRVPTATTIYRNHNLNRFFCTATSPSSVMTPLSLYQSKVDSAEIKHDVHQITVCEKLNEVHSKLLTYDRLPDINGYDSKIEPLLLMDTFDGESARSIEEHFESMAGHKSSLCIPSSLYIHGDVGTGKTMLMDLFYECCPQHRENGNLRTQKCRIHFQHFMRYIHLTLYEWKRDHDKGLNVTPDYYAEAAIPIQDEPENDGDSASTQSIECGSGSKRVRDQNEVRLHGHRVTKLQSVGQDLIGSKLNGFGLSSSNHQEEEEEDDPIYRGPDLMQMVAKAIANEIYVLCFDEIQITDSTNLSLLSYLFCYLYQYGVVVVGTSNRDPKELFHGDSQHLLLTPFLKTIGIYSDIIAVESGNDHRKDTELALSDSLPYFVVVGEDADRGKSELNALWMDVIGGDVDGVEYDNNELVKLYGRTVNLKQYHLPSKSVYFTFKELCENLYGPYDYIYIANKFENIFIENIPKLTVFTQKNEARRFIWLIDAVYESKSKLYCTSQRDVESLFDRQQAPNAGDEGEGIWDDFMYKETMGNLVLDELSSDGVEGDERISQVSRGRSSATQYEEERNTKNLLLEQQKSIFSGEEEVFAFKRAISRIFEMNSKKYRMRSLHDSESGNIEFLENLQIPKSIPPRNDKFGLSISEQLRLRPRKTKKVEIRDHHISGFAKWGTAGSGLARSLREKFWSRKEQRDSAQR